MPKNYDSSLDKQENPIWTKADFETAQPARKVLPDKFFDAIKRERGQRGVQKAPTKQQVTLRLDPEIIDYFKLEQAEGWQTRLNQALKTYIREHPL